MYAICWGRGEDVGGKSFAVCKGHNCGDKLQRDTLKAGIRI